MLSKSFVLRAPVDSQVVPLEQFLTTVAKSTTQSYTGSYVGTEKAGLEIETPFTPQFIIIFRNPEYGRITTATTFGEPVISMMGMRRWSWENGVGLVKDAVTDIQYKKFILGVNSSCNALGTTYAYFILG